MQIVFNLTANEGKFLADKSAKEALQLGKVKELTNKLEGAKKARFDASIQLAKIVSTSLEWFKGPKGREVAQKYQLEWNTEDFALKTFGFQKSYFYKLAKAGAHPEPLVKRYLLACDKEDSQGNDAPRSIEGLNSFVLTLEKRKEEERAAKLAKGSDSEEGEGNEGESANDTNIVSKAKIIFSMNFAPNDPSEGKKVTVKIDSKGRVLTSNSPEDMEAAFQYLKEAVINDIAKKEKAAKEAANLKTVAEKSIQDELKEKAKNKAIVITAPKAAANKTNNKKTAKPTAADLAKEAALEAMKSEIF